MTRTIIIIHPGALGDVLLAVPAMRRLKEQFPRRQLMLCANGPVAQLLLECRVIDAWISMQGIVCASLFNRDAPVEGQLKSWLARCDCAVAWTQDEDGTLAETLRNTGARSVIVSSPFSSGLKARHQSDRFCESLAGSPIRAKKHKPLQVSQQIQMHGRHILQQAGIQTDQALVVIHPGSGSPRKSVGFSTMASMIAEYQQEGFTSMVIEGPADCDAVRRLMEETTAPKTVIRDLSLPVLAGVLSHAKMFVGHDSGVTHLAALLGIPTIAIFGPTDPERWAPLGSHVTVIKSPLPQIQPTSLSSSASRGQGAPV